MDKVTLDTALSNEEELDALRSNCFVKFVFDARGAGTIHMTLGDQIGVPEIYHALLASISGVYCAMKSDPDFEEAGEMIKQEIIRQVNGDDLWSTEDDPELLAKLMN